MALIRCMAAAKNSIIKNLYFSIKLIPSESESRQWKGAYFLQPIRPRPSANTWPKTRVAQPVSEMIKFGDFVGQKAKAQWII